MAEIEVVPLAFESLGVRSMCTFVETPDVRVLIDAGVSLGPRYMFLPHPLEYKAREECRRRLTEAAKKADIITISHYHNDHHTPNYVDTVWIGSSPEIAREIYRDKTVLLKDIRGAINLAQRRRGWIFQMISKKFVKSFEAADGRTFEYGRTKLKFSTPVPHGEENSQLGWVLMLTIERSGVKVLHASDVQGPVADKTLTTILSESPDILIVGGPPIYLAGYKIDDSMIARSLASLNQIARSIPMVILDHHLLRAENWREFVEPALKAAMGRGHEILTAAEFLKQDDNALECKRQKLYEEHPPSEDFLSWTKLPREERRLVPPPIED